jgi:hypothetical protein
MEKNSEIIISDIFDGLYTDGCKVIDKLECERIDFYLIEADEVDDNKKYTYHFEGKRDHRWFTTIEECYRDAITFLQRHITEFYDNLEEIEDILYNM